MCGIAAVIGNGPDLLSVISATLVAEQNRGPAMCGIGDADGVVRCIGTVMSAMSRGAFRRFANSKRKLVGHVRYPTKGGIKKKASQPHGVEIDDIKITLASNGDLPPKIYDYWRAWVCKKLQREPVSHNDGELIAWLLAIKLSEGLPHQDAVNWIMDNVDGAYSVVFIHGEVVGAFRDPQAIRPMFFGQDESGLWHVASESSALQPHGIFQPKEVEGGQLILFGNGEPVSYQLVTRPKRRCSFEFNYFAIVAHFGVYETRRLLGQLLARQLKDRVKDFDVVVPVPQSANLQAQALAEALGLPFEFGISANRYVGRGFLAAVQKDREKVATTKYLIVRSVVYKKRILLIDDSIVRSTTMRNLIALLRQAGAAEVGVGVTAPAVEERCGWGTNTPTTKELIAFGRTVEDVRQIIGADSLTYLSFEGQVEAMSATGYGCQEFCYCCFGGQPPTPTEPPLRII